MRSLKDLWLWRRVAETVTPLSEPKQPARPQPLARLGLITTLDLHGLTIRQAFEATRELIANGRAASLTHVTVITGRSGQIRQEFPIWLETFGVRRYAELNGGGAFKIRL